MSCEIATTTVSDLRHHYKPNVKPPSRETGRLLTCLGNYHTLYEQSELAIIIKQQLQTALKISNSPVDRILSLGLGSLHVKKDRSRRLKQLALLIALRQHLSGMTGKSVDIFAQDPDFTRADEAFLGMLNINILHTPSGSSLGEASQVISPSTLIYSPFLTIEVYEQLMDQSGLPIQYVFGDDFNALLKKWPKHSEERKQVEAVIRMGLSKFQRKATKGAGFWTEEDVAFPMAIYTRPRDGKPDRLKSKI